MYSSYSGSHAAALLVAKSTFNSITDVENCVAVFQKIVVESNYKRENIEKLMFLVESYCSVSEGAHL